MKVRWSASARQDRLEIRDYIVGDNRRAAARMNALFSKAAARLADHPHLGKPGQIPGTREMIPHESYRLVYEVGRQTVWVLALVHTARLWPPARE
ncbi:MAG: type II toxin-antitoxin system RelE/ParE family toxin [Azoarcus sp.]|nr:type II toxin-antitoxin system RelE/ParE family toxin [Azoarcus sp.]